MAKVTGRVMTEEERRMYKQKIMEVRDCDTCRYEHVGHCTHSKGHTFCNQYSTGRYQWEPRYD